jgi:large subunit ribosomal protein L5
MNANAPQARLKTSYLEEIRPMLVGRFGYSSVMQAPRIEKVTLNMGLGQAKQDSKVLRAASEQLAMIAGQQPSVRRARKSVAAFKLREGMPVGVAVTLRGERGYEFLDRLISIAIPRIRDFRGLSPRSFDGRGNYSLGVREQIIFPEVDYDAIDEVRGLDITITTTATSDAEAFALLFALGMPFAARGRPAGFDDAELGQSLDNGETGSGVDVEQATDDAQGLPADAGATGQDQAEQQDAEQEEAEQEEAEQDDAEQESAEQDSAEQESPEGESTGAVEPDAQGEAVDQDGGGEDDVGAGPTSASALEPQDGHDGTAMAVDATGAARDGAEQNDAGAPATAADTPGEDDSAKQNDAEETDS